MRKSFSFLRSKPLHYLLLPVFFVWHGFTDNFNAVPLKDAFFLLPVYLLVSFLFFLIGKLFFKQPYKAAVFSFCIMAFHFFFGAAQDFLKTQFDNAFISRYSVLLPFSLAGFVALIVYLKKTARTFNGFNFYLNSLLFLLLIIDTGGLLVKIFKTPSPKSFQSLNLNKCAGCTKPDIYFLIFDEYTSSTALKEQWNYDNSDLDSFLVKHNFLLLPHSRSNYNFTQFSIASTLSMDYLDIPDPNACVVKDYNTCYQLIKTNNVCSILKSLGYKIVNYSIFDLPENPSLVTEDFLPLKTKLITSQTFLSRLRKDLYYHLLIGKWKIDWLTKDLIYVTYNNNRKIIDKTVLETSNYQQQPKFVYSHIEMPHPPYYFDKYGRLKDKQKLMEEGNLPEIHKYLDYLPKTNEVIKQLTDSIILHAKKPTVIVLMGDHGFRSQQPQKYFFRNLNAVYLSSNNHAGFYDSISNVNQFRVLFNNLFNASLPLKKDSTVFLTDK